MKDNDYKKIKNPNKKYNSFKIVKTVKPDVYELYLYNEQKTNFQKHSYASICDLETSRWLKELTDSKDECFVECKFNPLFQKWSPLINKETNTADTIIDVK